MQSKECMDRGALRYVISFLKCEWRCWPLHTWSHGETLCQDKIQNKLATATNETISRFFDIKPGLVAGLNYYQMSHLPALSGFFSVITQPKTKLKKEIPGPVSGFLVY